MREPPKRIGPYAVERKLADGGMGAVFLGRDAQGTRVVIKIPHAQDRESALALIDEARAGMRFKHPAIVDTLDCLEDRGVTALVVAFIDGKSLFELRRHSGPLSARAVAEAGAALADALAAIHGAVDDRGQPLSMVHRDVGPNNIIVDVQGQARLIDLGIVRSADRKQKATMQGMVKGTLRYLAPEILNGGDHSPATDLWALGLTLYEAALGRYAVAGDEMAMVRSVMTDQLFADLKVAPIDPALRDVLAVLVAPVDARMRNARAATQVLERLRTSLGGTAVGRGNLSRAVRGVPSAVTAPPPEATDAVLALDVGNASPPPSSATAPPTVEATAATMISSRGDVESVFTSTASRASLSTASESGSAPTLMLQRVDVVSGAALHADTAATLQMPAVDPTPALDIETAPTMQMGAWTPATSSAPVPTVAPLAPHPQGARPAPVPLGPSALRTEGGPPRPAPKKPEMKPAASLFLPIVVVDEDGDEIE